MGILGNILGDEENEEEPASGKASSSVETTEDKPAVKGNDVAPKNTRWDLVIAAGILLLAVAVRLYFLVYVTDPQNAGEAWYDDTYHHWQVAWLTRDIGLDKGFLRLWDLKGMEYFWGPVHPLLMMAMFKITGSVSIVNARVLSIIFGSLVIAALYLIVRKLWNRQAALAAAMLAIAHPVAILNDASGMLEPIGLFLMLVGILLVNSAPLLTGILWGLAAMARAEDWMFGGLLLLLSVKAVKKSGQLPGLFAGYAIVIGAYMKYLLDHTGNPIYPIWWNWLANARGAWSTETAINAYQMMVRPYLVAWFVISLVLFAWVVWKARGEKKLFLGLGLAMWAFIGGFMGLTHYLKGFEPWFWIIRFFEFPYVFGGCLLVVGLLALIPGRVKMLGKLPLSLALWVPVVLLGILNWVVFWPPILARYNQTRPVWARTAQWSKELVKGYQGGRILFPEGYASILYHFAYDYGVEGRGIEGQMFDPFYYMTGDPFADWGTNRAVILGWLKDDDIRYLIVETDRERYQKLIEREPEVFEKVGDAGPFVSYRVRMEGAKL